MAEDPQDTGAIGHSVFISFCSKDRRTAKLVCKELEHRGLPCWISSRDARPGENYQAAIVRAIKSAKVVVLLFTASANDSDEIKKELSLASWFKSAVIPIRVEDVSMDEAFSYELATRQWIDTYMGWEAALANLAQSARSYIKLQASRAAVSAMTEPAPLAGAAPGAITPSLRPINLARLQELEQLSARRGDPTASPPAPPDFVAVAATIMVPEPPAAPYDRPVPSAPAVPSQPPPPLPAAGQEAIQAALAAQLGPIARVLVRKFAAEANSLADLVERAAAEIANLEGRSAFRRDCIRGLGKAMV